MSDFETPASSPPPKRDYPEPATPPEGVSHRVLSYWPEPAVTDAFVAESLASAAQRRAAHRHLLFSDHHVLRVLFQNAHPVGDQMWRSNQPSPAQLERWAQKGVRTVINLRGLSPKPFHLLEREACARLGLDLVTLRLNSRDAPWPAVPRMVKQMLDTIRYPALMHCKSGADRAGIMGVFYRHFRLGEPVRTAMEQLSGKYLHIKSGKTGILDAYFEEYLRVGAPAGLSLIEWSENVFDPLAFKASFKPGAVGNFLVDALLRRE